MVQENIPRGRTSNSYSEYKTAKNKFKMLQDQAIKEYEDSIYRDIDEAAELDICLFWKLMNNFKNKNTNNGYEIKCNDSLLNDPNDIVSAFGKYFKNLYDWNNTDPLNLLNINVQPENSDYIFENIFEAHEISMSIKQLILRKAPGHYCLRNEI